eukprot:13550288-Alexandrium_andersonii.AAC.1
MPRRPALGSLASPSTGGSGRPTAVSGRCFSAAPPSRRPPMSAGRWATGFRVTRPPAPVPTSRPTPGGVARVWLRRSAHRLPRHRLPTPAWPGARTACLPT